MAARYSADRYCFEGHPDTGFACSRLAGHKGRHIARMSPDRCGDPDIYLVSWKNTGPETA